MARRICSSRFLLLLPPLLTSCSDDTRLNVKSSPPVVSITSPADGSSFDEGEIVAFSALTDDAEEPPEDLWVTWSSDIDGTLLDGASPDADGRVTFATGNLSVGNPTITLSVVDGDALRGEDWVQLTIREVADNPELIVVHPASGESGVETQGFEFVVLVSDAQDDPAELLVSFESDLDGVICTPTPDAAGLASCVQALSGGIHNLLFTVVDLDDNPFSRTAVFPVLAAEDYDWDEDGYTASRGDCDDRDPSVHPLATEYCNEVDDDCDGTIDEGTPCYDDDGDGFSEMEGDCNDGLATAWPGAPELCDGIDQDCDGRIDEETPCVDDDGDLFAEMDGDCDDGSALVFPGAPEWPDALDNDCDGIVDEGTTAFDDDGDCACETPLAAGCSGTVSTSCASLGGGDCDDSAPAVSPSATERCNGLDDDCDGTTDENDAIDASTWYLDADTDGYGTPFSTTRACTAPPGWVAAGTDCDDRDAAVNPGAMESCNGLDDDCDGGADEGVLSAFYQDADADGYGNAAVVVWACAAPPGYLPDATDCDDTRASVRPSASETCNGLDDDCDGAVDEASATDAPTWYLDADADGYGNASVSTRACSAPSGYVSNRSDCNDANNTVNPAASERCNGMDDDCDGSTDENDAIDASVWYADADGDGYGNASASTRACTAPSGHVSNGSDCDDTRATVRPFGTETCNGLDDDCDGSTDEGVTTTYYRDADGDGYGSPSVTLAACSLPSGYVTNNLDCDDSNAALNPTTVWYLDADGDGYGTSSTTLTQCTRPTGYVANATDCNDTTSLARPGATEACDGIDNDCDSSVDEAGATGCATWYYDYDYDGYGGSTYQCLCSSSGYYRTRTAGDCYDYNAWCYPGGPWASTSNRGDGSYDYDCDGVESRLYTSTWSCSVDWTGFACSSYTNGWSGSPPACGGSGTWRSGCTASWWSCTSTASYTSYQACY